MRNAILRLFLISFPLLPLFFALILSKNSLKKNSEEVVAPFKAQCPPLIGVSPFFFKQNPHEKKPINQPQNLTHYPFISETNFFKQVSLMKNHFKQNKIPSNHLLITLPLYLTKDNHWLISNKSFIISQNLERKELSHLNYKNLQQSFFNIHKSNPLTLNKILRKYPRTSLLIKLKGQNDEKILKQLNFLTSHQGLIYLLSLNEDLLKQISENYPKVLLLHSFKKLIRFQFLNILQIKSFVNFPGDGILIPSSLPLSNNVISHIKKLKKILILEDENFNGISKTLATSINGLVSSSFQSSLEFIKYKKSCFLK